MKKLILFVIVIIFIFTLVDSKKNEEIRVRIIPNSNSESDLIAKDEVKKLVTYYLYNIYDEDYNNYINNINASVGELEEILKRKCVDCMVSFDNHTLYNKTYNGNKVRDKRCLVLLIILGEGKGDNWWGSVYPKYLEVESEDVIEYESLFVNLINKIKGEKNED